MNINKGSRTKLPIILIITLAAVLIVGFLLVRARSHSQTYANIAIESKSVLDTAVNINHKISSIKSASSIDNTAYLTLEKSYGDMDKSAKQLLDSATYLQGSPIRSQAQEGITSAAVYVNSLRDTLISIRHYLVVTYNCTTFTRQVYKGGTIDTFSTESKPCTDAINDAKTSTKTEFKNQFLSEYTDGTSQMIQLLFKLVQVAGNKEKVTSVLTDIAKVNQKLGDLTNKNLDLVMSPDPAPSLQKLKNSTTEQANNFSI